MAPTSAWQRLSLPSTEPVLTNVILPTASRIAVYTLQPHLPCMGRVPLGNTSPNVGAALLISAGSLFRTLYPNGVGDCRAVATITNEVPTISTSSSRN